MKTFNLSEVLLRGLVHPEKTLFYHDDGEYKAKTLHGEVRSFGIGLQQQGIQAGDRVLCLLNDTPAFIVAFLGSIAIGAIPVAVNPRSKKSTVEYLLADSDCRLVVCEVESYRVVKAATTDASSALVVIQDQYAAGQLPEDGALGISNLLVQSQSPCEFKFHRQSPSDPCFWQYTSGTTGQPKGVVHNGGGMLESHRLFAKGLLGIGDTDKIYSVPKMFFGYGLGNSMFFPLLAGGSAVISSRWPNPEEVISNIEKHRPSVFFSVPAVYSALLYSEEGGWSDVLRDAKVLFSAGSQLGGSLFGLWQQRFGREILDGIGATEMGHVFLSNEPGAAQQGSTGKVVAGYEVKLQPRNPEDSNLKRGVLWVKGPSQALEYWRKPQVTSDKFLSGWYRTGDVFQSLAEGHFKYCGREDDLFKVNGRWVAPLEIEQLVVRLHLEVSEAVVVPGGDDETVPHLYVTLTPGFSDSREVLKEEILATCKERFESYKRPREIYFIDSLPRNDNGKIVRHELGLNVDKEVGYGT